MGHLLATVNPEAAAAIGKENTPSMLPPIGTFVRYYPRPMEGRGGRTEFAFLVTEQTGDGRVGGVAIFDAQDWRDVRPCWQRTEANPCPAWDWIQIPPNLMPPAGAQSVAGEITPPTARSVAEKIASLTHEVHVLQSSLSKAFAEILELRQAGPSKGGVTTKRFEDLFKRVDELEFNAAGAASTRLDLVERVTALEGEFGIAPPAPAPKGGKRK